MRKWIVSVLFISVFVLGSMVSAQASFKFYFDEYGNGLYSQNGGALTRATFQENVTVELGGEAAYTITGAVYTLPEDVVPGMVRIWESPCKTDLSDALYFQGNQMWFLSDPVLIPEPGVKTDVSWVDWGKIQLYIATHTLNDLGGVVEDANGDFVYKPGGNEYYGRSEAVVPIPPSVFLMVPGLIGLVGLRRKFIK